MITLFQKITPNIAIDIIILHKQCHFFPLLIENVNQSKAVLEDAATFLTCYKIICKTRCLIRPPEKSHSFLTHIHLSGNSGANHSIETKASLVSFIHKAYPSDPGHRRNSAWGTCLCSRSTRVNRGYGCVRTSSEKVSLMLGPASLCEQKRHFKKGDYFYPGGRHFSLTS